MAYNSEYSGSKKGSSSNLHRDDDEESQSKIVSEFSVFPKFVVHSIIMKRLIQNCSCWLID